MISDCPRAHTRPVTVGDIVIGGGAPVVVQSMTSTDTADATATLGQVRTLAELGCDLVRVTLPHADAIDAFHQVCAESPVPIIADIHFDYKLALAAITAGAAKLRINPGNIGSWDRVDAVVDAAGEAGVALRIGVNAGSLERTVAERDDLTPAREAPRLLVAICGAYRGPRIHADGAFGQGARCDDHHRDISRAFVHLAPGASPSWRYGGRYPFPGNHQELRGARCAPSGRHR